MTFPDTERWSRGCGNGGLAPIGSTQGDGYRFGVLEKNWVEELSGKDLAPSRRSVFNHGAPPRVQSTQQESYTLYGKVGEDLIHLSKRQDRELSSLGQPRDVLLRHGNFLHAPIDCSTSLYSLTYDEKRFEEPRVQAYLWTASNAHNRTVPLKVSSLNLTRKKVDQWTEDMDPYSTFKTTWRSASLPTALRAAELPGKVTTIKPMADGGQVAQVSRKPLGPHVEECDKNYRRIGLRDTWCTFLTTPKH